MDKGLVEGDLAKLVAEFTKFHKQMLPALGHGVANMLDTEHKEIVE